jgi:hypothetical protein
MSSSWYDIAQICLNGHLINKSYKEYPVHNQDHCDKCGEETITSCPNCETPIKGRYNVPGVAGGSSYSIPRFCHNCGESYPWTKLKIDAARELTEELDELDAGEKEKLKKSLDDLVKETPKTELAKTRFKKVAKKLGKESYESLKGMVIEVISESVRKSLFGM